MNNAPSARLLEILSSRQRYPSPSRVTVKDYARLEAEVRSALIVQEVKARLKADKARLKAFWKTLKARKG